MSVARSWLPLWVIPFLILMAIGTVYLRLSIIRTTYAINQADKDFREQKQALEQAEFKVTGLRSPKRLESLARSRFNLTQPKSEQIIHLSPKQTAPQGVKGG